MSSVKLIVGLGNPGQQYVQTRHNAGFWFVEDVARQYGVQFRPETKFLGEAARVQSSGLDVWLLKPMTYMNRSGQSIQALAKFYKIAPEEILVVHDELDLEPGVARLKKVAVTVGITACATPLPRWAQKSFSVCVWESATPETANKSWITCSRHRRNPSRPLSKRLSTKPGGSCRKCWAVRWKKP